jgi:hypothetical protein
VTVSIIDADVTLFEVVVTEGEERVTESTEK